MKIRAIHVGPDVEIKIYEKHNVSVQEIYELFAQDKTEFRRVGGNQYMAIGPSKNRYLTLFFTYDNIAKEIDITTAYPSSKKQIRIYKKVRK
ncbi:MAG TPA: hypothetical protein VJG90_04450 [Candidatus Nanoarchaeia archaeon]|nr:hypothetical protein [Candidatus Nanoarchaeia archaeon]